MAAQSPDRGQLARPRPASHGLRVDAEHRGNLRWGQQGLRLVGLACHLFPFVAVLARTFWYMQAVAVQRLRTALLTNTQFSGWLAQCPHRDAHPLYRVEPSLLGWLGFTHGTPLEPKNGLPWDHGTRGI
jgi:hypothetical protein